MIDLNSVAKEIRGVISEKQKELNLTFVEETHTYYIKDENGIIRSDYPSVSKLVDKFYEPFDAEQKSYDMCGGDLQKQEILLTEWKSKGDYATNMGSRVHYELEKELIGRYGNYKELRMPEFVCDVEQITKSDNMIAAGNKFLDLMINERKAVLLDTETILGSTNLKYFGTPDKNWLVLNKKKDNFFLYCTDWKTNNPKNFEIQRYTKNLYPPFDQYPSTALQHYYIQIPLYIRLLLDMLKGSKFENINIGACIVVLLKDDGTFEEFRVPDYFLQTLLTIDLSPYLS